MTNPKIDPETVAKMLDGVTPGPWKCCETTIHGRKYGGCWVEGPDVDDGDGRPHGLLIPISGSGGAKSFTTRLVDIQGHDHNDANARFIAWAREAVPALAARVAELEAEFGMARTDADQTRIALRAAEAQLAARDAECAKLREELAQRTNDCQILLAQIDGVEDATGKAPEGEDALIVAQIRAALQEKSP